MSVEEDREPLLEGADKLCPCKHAEVTCRRMAEFIVKWFDYIVTGFILIVTIAGIWLLLVRKPDFVQHGSDSAVFMFDVLRGPASSGLETDTFSEPEIKWVGGVPMVMKVKIKTINLAPYLYVYFGCADALDRDRSRYPLKRNVTVLLLDSKEVVRESWTIKTATLRSCEDPQRYPAALAYAGIAVKLITNVFDRFGRVTYRMEMQW